MIQMTHCAVCLLYCALHLARNSNSLCVSTTPLRHVPTVLQRGKICKPYNSVLGEHFRAHWDVIPVSYPDDPADPPVQHLYVTLPASSKSDTVSITSTSSRLNIAENKVDNVKNGDTLSVKSSNSGTNNKNGNYSPSSAPDHAVGETLAAGMSSLSLAGSVYNTETGELIEGEVEGGERVRVIYLVCNFCGAVSNDDS